MNKKINRTIRINKCRVCGSNNLKNLYSLGNQYVNNFIQKKRFEQMC